VLIHAEGGMGCALVIRQGLVAWMNAWPRPACKTLPEPNLSLPDNPPALPMASPLRAQLTHILVNIILHSARRNDHEA
jgi:hypothetical protein